MESKPETDSSGNTFWYNSNFEFHREDGPAIIWENHGTEWFINGKLHRLDGPAVEFPSGHTFWWINGFPVTDEIQEWAKDLNIDLDNLSEEDKFMIRLYWENYTG